MASSRTRVASVSSESVEEDATEALGDASTANAATGLVGSGDDAGAGNLMDALGCTKGAFDDGAAPDATVVDVIVDDVLVDDVVDVGAVVVVVSPGKGGSGGTCP